MSDTAVADAPQPAPPSTGTVQVEVDKLIIGREVSFPIYGDDGVFLLAAGSVITGDLKEKLRERGVASVSLHEDDVANTTLQVDGEAPKQYSVVLDGELTKELDKVIDAGMLSVSNTETAVFEKIVQHGTTSYDESQRQEMIEQHTELCDNVDDMIQQVADGGKIEGDDMRNVAATFLSSMIADADSSLSVAFEACDDRALADHALKSSMLAMAIGIEMGFDAPNVRELGVTGLVHDWGMCRVPQHIREAPGPLSDSDVFEIQKHPLYTLDMLERVNGLPKITRLVSYQVHERPDGSGYPKGRRREHIHQFARILQVADSYVALTTPRPFRRPLLPYSAMECLLRQSAENLVDRDVVRALLNMQSLFPIGTYVTLSNGSVAQVIRRNSSHYMTPIVELRQDGKGQEVERGSEASIVDLARSELSVVQALSTPGRNEIAFSQNLLNSTTRI